MLASQYRQIRLSVITHIGATLIRIYNGSIQWDQNGIIYCNLKLEWHYLGIGRIDQSGIKVKGSGPYEPPYNLILGGKPEFKIVFKELYSLATQWKTIGALLGISKPVLDKIKSDEERADDRLQEMLSEWLKQTDSPPTWTKLADAVEIINKSKAQKLREHCLDAPEN